jgi:hypothetical protein
MPAMVFGTSTRNVRCLIEGISMARLNLEDSLFSSDEYRLYEIKSEDRDKALGAWIRTARLAQRYWVQGELIPESVWELHELPDLLIKVGLAEKRENGIYLKGSEEQFAWLVSKVENGKKGGRPSKNNDIGKATKNPKETESNRGESDRNPLTLPLSLTLTQDIYIVETEILEFWNSQNIIKHKPSKRTLKKISDALKKRKDYSKQEILDAISNYAQVLNGEKYYFTHKWTLIEFLTRKNTDRFYDDFIPENFIDHSGSKKTGSSNIRAGMIKRALYSGALKLADLDSEIQLNEHEENWIRDNGGLNTLNTISSFELNDKLKGA